MPLHIALIGASEKPSLSQKLFFRLEEAGFKVFPVNPNCTKLGKMSCFPDLSQLPTIPDAVVFMVNPKLTLQILQEVVHQKIKKVWFQPGTFDDEVIVFCKEHHIDYENEKCLLVAPVQVLEEFVAS